MPSTPFSINVGESKILTLEPKDSNGAVLTGRAVSGVQSSDPTKISVTGPTTGTSPLEVTVHGEAAGAANISASCEGIAGSIAGTCAVGGGGSGFVPDHIGLDNAADVTVAEDAADFTRLATLRDASNVAGAGTIACVSSNPSALSVTPASGASPRTFTLNPQGPGSGTLTYSSAGVPDVVVPFTVTAATSGDTETPLWQAFATPSDLLAVFSPKQAAARTVDGNGKVLQLRDLLGGSITLDALAANAGTLDGNGNLVLPAGKSMLTAALAALDVSGSTAGYAILAIYKNQLGTAAYVLRSQNADGTNPSQGFMIYGNGADGISAGHRTLLPTYTVGDPSILVESAPAMRAVHVGCAAHAVPAAGAAANTVFEVFDHTQQASAAVIDAQSQLQQIVVGEPVAGYGGTMTLACLAILKRSATVGDLNRFHTIATGEHAAALAG